MILPLLLKNKALPTIREIAEMLQINVMNFPEFITVLEISGMASSIVIDKGEYFYQYYDASSGDTCFERVDEMDIKNVLSRLRRLNEYQYFF